MSEQLIPASSLLLAFKRHRYGPQIKQIQDAVSAGAAAPELTSLVPIAAELGSEDLTLHCLGSGFTEGSVIVFNGGVEPTIFVSDVEVTTIVKPSTASIAVTVPVLVLTGAHETEELDFEFTEAAPAARKAKAKR
jgi:hypothetical protein